MEPWIGLSTCSDEGDKFEEKRNIQYAQAGEVKEYEFHINIIENKKQQYRIILVEKPH